MHEKCNKLATSLRTDRHILEAICNDLERASGKVGILEKIVDENDAIIRDRLDFLGLGRNIGAYDVYDALISKVEADDLRIYEGLHRPNLHIPEEALRILYLAETVSGKQKGFFLKKEVARKFLFNEPPRLVMAALGYDTVDAMLSKEDLMEVYCSLRFLESSNWLNEVFFKQYENLTPDDFEERDITSKVLGQKWVAAAEKFTKKKYHNVSHLKELGVIFVIPISLGYSGETLRLLSLLNHYFNEIYFYSDLFRMNSRDPETFSKNLISLLRGDVLERRLPQMLNEARRSNVLVIQRYLAKDDENDWRLFEPHVNPEAMHWEKAENGIVKVPDVLPEIKDGMHFWKDLGWAGDYFKDEVGRDIFVSFNLVDTVMSLVMEKQMTKFLYHHQEALWNKIFIAHLGEEKVTDLIKKNMIRGWFEI